MQQTLEGASDSASESFVTRSASRYFPHDYARIFPGSQTAPIAASSTTPRSSTYGSPDIRRRLAPIPYGQGSPVPDLLGDRIDMVFDAVSPYLENIKAGKLRALAVTGERRISALPNVPTFIKRCCRI